MKWTKRTIGGAVLGAALAGTAAFAAVQLWGSGHAAVAATVSQGIVIDQVSLVNPLVPGGVSAGQGVAHNPNNFSVKITDVIVWDLGATATPAGCAGVSVGGSPQTGLVKNGNGDTAAGHVFHLASPVTIAANQHATITAPAVVSQASTASAFCGFEADLGVIAETAGN